MDITTYTMILTCKLSAIAYCYADGAEKEEDLLPEQKLYKVEKMPSALEMLSYVYFCSGCIVGPFFEFNDYKMYIERTGRYSNIPSALWPAFVKFLKGKACLVSNLIIGQKFWALHCGTEEYAKEAFLYKLKFKPLITISSIGCVLLHSDHKYALVLLCRMVHHRWSHYRLWSWLCRKRQGRQRLVQRDLFHPH